MRIEFSRKRIEPAVPDFTARMIGAVKARIGGIDRKGRASNGAFQFDAA
jgi:hypothetical protein